jgi:hypothetical protein
LSLPDGFDGFFVGAGDFEDGRWADAVGKDAAVVVAVDGAASAVAAAGATAEELVPSPKFASRTARSLASTVVLADPPRKFPRSHRWVVRPKFASTTERSEAPTVASRLMSPKYEGVDLAPNAVEGPADGLEQALREIERGAAGADVEIAGAKQDGPATRSGVRAGDYRTAI